MVRSEATLAELNGTTYLFPVIFLLAKINQNIIIGPHRQAQRPAEEAKYNQPRMHVCMRMCKGQCGNMSVAICGRTRAGKRTGKEFSLFCAKSAKVASSSDYYA